MTTTHTSPTPFGRTRDFVERVRQAKGDSYVASWLSRQNCVFGATVVWATPYTAERLRDEVFGLARACGVEIKSGARFGPNVGTDAVLAAP